jgi:hypothetical protein
MSRLITPNSSQLCSPLDIFHTHDLGMFQSEMRFTLCCRIVANDGFNSVDDDLVGSITYSVDVLRISAFTKLRSGQGLDYLRLAIPIHQLSAHGSRS